MRWADKLCCGNQGNGGGMTPIIGLLDWTQSMQGLHRDGVLP